jgi:hypothetical protein
MKVSERIIKALSHLEDSFLLPLNKNEEKEMSIWIRGSSSYQYRACWGSSVSWCLTGGSTNDNSIDNAYSCLLTLDSTVLVSVVLMNTP